MFSLINADGIYEGLLQLKIPSFTLVIEEDVEVSILTSPSYAMKFSGSKG